MDAITAATKDFEPPQRFEGVRRRVVIIAGGTDPCYSHDQTLSLIRQRLANRQIHPEFRFIGIDIPPDEQQQFKRIADATAGEVSLVGTQAELEDVLKRVLEIEPVHNDINVIVEVLNEQIDLISDVIESVEAEDYSDAANRIDHLPEVAQRATLPLRDLSRRRTNEDFRGLFEVARQLRSIQIEMIETVKALLANHQSGDREAYNKAVGSYNEMIAGYSSSVETAKEIMGRLPD